SIDMLEVLNYSYDDSRDLHSFPTRRSSDLWLTTTSSSLATSASIAGVLAASSNPTSRQTSPPTFPSWNWRSVRLVFPRNMHSKRDRKSTRLNSSHLVSLYAVFCMKKKIVNI